jgi:hypothetical protein
VDYKGTFDTMDEIEALQGQSIGDIAILSGTPEKTLEWRGDKWAERSQPIDLSGYIKASTLATELTQLRNDLKPRVPKQLETDTQTIIVNSGTTVDGGAPYNNVNTEADSITTKAGVADRIQLGFEDRSTVVSAVRLTLISKVKPVANTSNRCARL